MNRVKYGVMVSSRYRGGTTGSYRDFIILCCLISLGFPAGSQQLPRITPPVAGYLYPDMEIQSDQFKSSLTVSTKIPVSELERQINKELSGLLYEDKSYEDDGNDNLKAKVWKTGDIKVEALGNHFLFDLPLKIWASAGYKIRPFGYTLEGYRDTEFEMRVRLISDVSFSPDWQLVTTTRVDSYDWVTDPTISVIGLSIPIKGMISGMLNRNAEKITKAIDKEIRENFQIRDKVEQTWILAQQPQLLSETYPAWLINTPEEIEARLPDARDGFMNLKVSIKGYTQTIVSKIPPVRSKIVKLPPLKVVDNLPQSFHVGLISSISYEEASDMAEAYFKDKTCDLSGGRYSVRIEKIALYGQNEHLIIHARLSGSINGDIYLKGIPGYDPDTRTLFLENLDYDINTRNVLVRAANWLLHGKFLKMMREAMVFPVADQLDTLINTLRESMAHHTISDGIVLKGKLDNATPDKVHLTPEHIYTVIHATGNLDLQIEKINY